ncbi:MAG TPA: APC family permease [Tepidiformaceae bacterium]|nr:APC family permease [Tepidiformaceae bacterium]
MASPGGSGPQFSPGTDRRGRISRYRVELPHAEIVETHRGHFEATEYAERRTGWKGRYLALRDRVLGTTLASTRLESEKLNKIRALPIFSSDAISSVAYATQEILFVLVVAGAGAIKWSLPVGLAILVLLAIVVTSYRQTVRAYPNGGGSYIVAHENIGVVAGLVAAASLLIDYVLTVAVSVASGIDALASINSEFRPIAVPLAVGLVCVVALLNLRGIRESGTLFAIPTYIFVFIAGLAIAVVLGKVLGHGQNPLAAGVPKHQIQATESLGILLVLKAFANGCSALTGVEAISNGVQAFKAPAPKNAATTMVWMGVILGSLFIGITILARHLGFIPDENDTVLSQLAAHAFGDGSALFWLLNIMTAGILVLAANTSFNGFPMLAAVLARDGYMPRMFHARGNRLVFSVGILVLTALACALLIAFNATTTRLIPLYALGVFLSFTLCQIGLVKHWMRTREPRWRQSAIINAVGAAATALVFLVIIEAKFFEGAWIVVILIPILALGFWMIGRFYKKLQRSLYVSPDAVLDMKPKGESRVPIIVPVEDITLASVMTLGAACERSSEVTAVHVIVDPDLPSTVEDRWQRQFPSVPLVIIDSPFRTISDPIASYVVDRLHAAPHEVTVMVPSVEVNHWYERPLVNQSMASLKSLLAPRRQVAVVAYPFSPGSMGRRGG